MQFTYSHGYETKEAVFCSVENGAGAAAISRGYLCAWDTTDNSAVAGILQNTRGVRVIVYPTAESGATAGLCRHAGFAHTDMELTLANRRGRPYLIQVWGHRDEVAVKTTANGNIIAGGGICPSAGVAGCVDGFQVETAPSVNEIITKVGFAYDIVAAGGASPTMMQAFVKCL